MIYYANCELASSLSMATNTIQYKGKFKREINTLQQQQQQQHDKFTGQIQNLYFA